VFHISKSSQSSGYGPISRQMLSLISSSTMSFLKRKYQIESSL